MRINRAFPNVILFLENDPSTEVLEALEAVAFPLRGNVYRSGGADREADTVRQSEGSSSHFQRSSQPPRA